MGQVELGGGVCGESESGASCAYAYASPEDDDGFNVFESNTTACAFHT